MKENCCGYHDLSWREGPQGNKEFIGRFLDQAALKSSLNIVNTHFVGWWSSKLNLHPVARWCAMCGCLNSRGKHRLW